MSSFSLFLAIFVTFFLSCVGFYAYQKHQKTCVQSQLINLDSKIQHLAIIMDGNRRWAEGRGLPTLFGHQKGAEKLEFLVEFCLKHKIKYLSLYAFSLENFKRSDEEKTYLFDLFAKFLAEKTDKLKEHGICLRAVGDSEQFPQPLKEAINQAERETANENKLVINLLFCYGSQQEMVHAARRWAQCVVEENLQPGDLSLEKLKSLTWMGSIGEPDLIIRTGKCMRLSNFLLFQAAYSQLEFCDVYWPDFTLNDLEKICIKFLRSTRTYGGNK